MLPAMPEETELELLITVVVGADDERTARSSCHDLLQQVGGRIVESGDCADEEPGCWSVTISRAGESGQWGAAALSRAVRIFLRELGPEYAGHRVSCEPPTAWTVVDNPDLVGALVDAGERLLVEAWLGGTILPVGARFDLDDPDEVVDSGDDWHDELDPLDEGGRPRPRLRLVVDVVTERRAGAEWPSRALACRLSRTTAIVSAEERPPMVRVVMDLGPALGTAQDIVTDAVARLGGSGWSRLQVRDGTAVARWSAAPTPPSGIAAIELSASEPDVLASTAETRTSGATDRW
jgi:hypothetical protein